jgi:hypothetical protein
VGEGNKTIPPLPSWERGSGGEGVGLRIAVNTGEVVVSAANDDVVGDPVNVAARLQQEAHDGEVVIGESTRRLVGALVTLAPLGAVALKGRSETVAAYRVVSLELADNVATRFDEVLGLQADALLVRATHSGTARAGGGSYERQFFLLDVFAADGSVARQEYFDADCDAEALARFDALTGASSGPRIENAATRSSDRFDDAWHAHDWAGVMAVLAHDLRYIDRRGMLQLDLDREQFLGFIRPLFDMASSRLESQVLATRGDRLALSRFHFEGSDRDRGPTETESLIVVEVNDHGERGALVRFDADNLDAAYAELDARYAAGEAAPFAAAVEMTRAFVRAFGNRDWEYLAAQNAPDLVVYDHRRLGWETLDLRAYVAMLRALADLAPDARLRLEHVTYSARALFFVGAWIGTREGGAFEDRKVVVSATDELGRMDRVDQYNVDQLDEARARFAELCRNRFKPYCLNSSASGS